MSRASGIGLLFLFAGVPLALAQRQGRVATGQEPAPVDVDHPTTSSRVYVEIPSLPLDTMAHLATDIVHGRVVSQEQRFPERGLPHTVLHVETYVALKGVLLQERIEVQVGGAERPGERTEVVGAPHFADGEEVVLFLWRDPATDVTGILGLSRGSYRVRAATGGALRVTGLHSSNEDLDSFLNRVITVLDRPAPWIR